MPNELTGNRFSVGGLADLELAVGVYMAEEGCVANLEMNIGLGAHRLDDLNQCPDARRAGKLFGRGGSDVLGAQAENDWFVAESCEPPFAGLAARAVVIPRNFQMSVWRRSRGSVRRRNSSAVCR